LIGYLYDVVPQAVITHLESTFSEIQEDMEKYGDEIRGLKVVI